MEVCLVLTWLMYLHYMYLFLSKLKSQRAPGVSTERTYFFGEILQVDCLFYNVIKHNTNDYMVSEQIEYTAFLAAMSTANILIQK